tara:strand:- start:613 stop:1128 length:516 start_codon:yes stop_codon:yes gene_type:complete
MEIFLGVAYIFLLRLLDQTLGTLRALYVNKGKPLFGAGLGFIESAIWVVAISQVIKDLDDPYLIIGYALGFASGTIVGSYIESSIGIGDVVIRIFSSKDDNTKNVAKELRANGFGVTIINGEGMQGEVSILWCVAPRKKAKQVLNIVYEINPSAYVTTESTSPINLNGNRK